jgi:hypothetical protein
MGMSIMNYLHNELQLHSGDIVEVTLDHAANVQLLDSANFDQYKQGKRYSYHGGYYKETPVRLQAPCDGRWYIVVDLGGGPGTVRASLRVLSGAGAA